MGKTRKIVLDADVIIHFIKGGKILLLPKIFDQEKVILDIVLEELKKKPSTRQYYDNLVNFKVFLEVQFPSDLDIMKEFARLKKMALGLGESASMAYCRYTGDILGSSNLKDIERYCEANKIVHLSTMDFLFKALSDHLMEEADCDYFIYEVKSQGSILPCSSMKEFEKIRKKE